MTGSQMKKEREEFEKLILINDELKRDPSKKNIYERGKEEERRVQFSNDQDAEKEEILKKVYHANYGIDC